MKVKEVIEKLKEFDQDVDCLYWTGAEFNSIDRIESAYDLPEPTLYGAHSARYTARYDKAYLNSRDYIDHEAHVKLRRINDAIELLEKGGYTVDRGR